MCYCSPYLPHRYPFGGDRCLWRDGVQGCTTNKGDWYCFWSPAPQPASRSGAPAASMLSAHYGTSNIYTMNIVGILVVGLLAQQPRLASVEGTVVQAGSARPVVRAVVEISDTSKGDPLAIATGADGKFEFRNLAPGRYRLTASRNGYLESAYGKRGPNGTPTTLALEPGQTLKDIRLTMIATGAISGRVYDSNGEPLANVPVEALKYSYAEGQRKLTPVKTDRTDDRGEYRLFWLPPAQYYVSATPRGTPGSAFLVVHDDGSGRFVNLNARGLIESQRSAAEKLGEADAPVYYPGTADSQSAMPVEVRPGADIGGVDFTLARVKTHKVRGIAVDGVTGQPATNATVLLVPRNASIASSVPARPSSDGTFEIHGVFPGSYFAVATQRLVNGRDQVTMTGGRAPVDVGGSDIDRLTILLSPVREIAGELTLEGLRDTGNDYHHPVISLKSQFPVPAFGEKWALFNGNQFSIDNLIEGDYQVQVTDLPPGAYVKSIRFGSVDALNESLRFDSRTTDRLEIILSLNAGSLTGTVVNKNGEPVGNAPVALVPPQAQRQRADLYRSTMTDEAGRFRLQAIPPGDYALFAWEDIEDGLWRDPEFIQRNQASGRQVHIAESGRENIDLTAIPFAY